MLEKLNELNVDKEIGIALSDGGYSSYVSNDELSVKDNTNKFISSSGSYQYFHNPEIDDSSFQELLGNPVDLYLVKGSYYEPNSEKGQMAIMARYSNSTKAQEVLDGLSSAFIREGTGASLLSSKMGTHTEGAWNIIFAVEVIMPSEGEGGDEGEKPTTPLGNLSLEEASKFDGISGYLESNGYTQYKGTLEEYLSKSPDPYSFIVTEGKEWPEDATASGMPAGFREASNVTIIAGVFNQYEQATGFYAECKHEEAANDLAAELNAMGTPPGAVILLNEVFGNKVLWAFYAKISQPDIPTNPRRSIMLSNIIETSGEHIVEITPFNYDKNGKQQEGPRTSHLVKVQGFGFIVDNEGVNIVHQRNGAIVNEALECGMNLHLSTKDGNKMLPENINVNGNFSGSYNYIRQNDNYRFGWLNIYGPVDGDIYVNFGDLPDYEGSKITFSILSESTSELIESVSVSNESGLDWYRMASKMPDKFVVNDDMTVAYIVDGVGYTLKYDTNTNVVNAKDNIRAIRYYVIYTPPKTFTFTKLSGETETIMTSATTWSAYAQENSNFFYDGSYMKYRENQEDVGHFVAYYNGAVYSQVAGHTQIINNAVYYEADDSIKFGTITLKNPSNGGVYEVSRVWATTWNEQFSRYGAPNGISQSGDALVYTIDGEQFYLANLDAESETGYRLMGLYDEIQSIHYLVKV